MRFFTLFALLIFSLSVAAQEEGGVVFQEKTFDELLADAKAQDKLIFIDAYTTWCGPCKMMTAKVFPQEAVGSVYNKKFINAKFDMEKGEGPELARRFSVMAYPTYLFVNGDGELVHKGLGYIPATELLALADVAESDENLLALSNRYEGGDRNPEFVSSYINTLNDVYEKERAAEVTDAYLSGIDKKEWTSEPVMQMIMANPGELKGDRFQFMVANADAFKKMSSSARYVSSLQNILIPSFMEAKGSRALPALEEINPFLDENAGAMAEQLKANYAMIFAQRNDPDNYPAAVVTYFNTYPSDDAMELNSVAWTFYESVEDANYLKYALGWAMQSVSLDKQYMNMDTLAWLYKKMGNDAKAKEVAQEAIELAKASGEDYSSTLPILEE